MSHAIYQHTPTYQTERFLLRLIRPEDANDLLACYADPEAVACMNADNCTGNFYCATLADMQNAISFWLDEYRQERYIRFAIVDRRAAKAVGTMECFAEAFPGVGQAGLLRLDIASAYEVQSALAELLSLALAYFPSDFGVERMVFKAGHTPHRQPLLARLGFAPTEAFRPGLGYVQYTVRDLAYCGLACPVCSENASCAGCHEEGCASRLTCRQFTCCREKGLEGCWACDAFPCGEGMLAKPRVRAFARFAKTHGKQELIRCLLRNQGSGIAYHYEGELVGEYDQCKTEEDVMQLLLHGRQSDVT